MNQRIAGFDLARAYAIFGMFIVNYNIVFGNYYDSSVLGYVLSMFSGNSSTAFVILAGMGVSLLTWRPAVTPDERLRLRRLILRRSWFLFGLGLIFYVWWPADILHFYGGYMHLAALLLFVPQRWLLAAAAAAIAIWHILLVVIPYETGWDFSTLQYNDFWTIGGFLRNTLYNGWNPIFPWSAFFFFGMWLGRQDWQSTVFVKKSVIGSLIVVIPLQVAIYMAQKGFFSADFNFWLTADYIPPMIPFMVSGAAFSVLLIAVFFWIGNRWGQHPWLQLMSQTGQMTLTHYIVHLTIGMMLLSGLTGQSYFTATTNVVKVGPLFILSFVVFWFALSVVFSHFWKKRFKNGPFETLMRRFDNWGTKEQTVRDSRVVKQ
jgi:uncharacterized protein